MPASGIDLSWFRAHLLDDILPHWLEASQTDSGLFVPYLDRRWERSGEESGGIVSQGRLLYNFAVGYELTGDERYLAAVRRGADFLMGSFYDDVHGGWFWSCASDGTVLDAEKDSYGHAFVLFGLAHAARAAGGTALRAINDGPWVAALGMLSDAHGGMVPRMIRDFSARVDRERPRNSQNQMMHLFEALLAAGRHEGHPGAHKRAQAIADFLFDRKRRASNGALPELYHVDWTPLASEDGGRVDIGHQFEWAFLLSHAVELGFPESYLEWAYELLEYGLDVGYDRDDGGILADASLEGEVIRTDKGWWQQCEATRALLHHAIVRGHTELWEPFERTVAYFQRELVDPEYGGWYAGPDQSKGNPWKVDYHVVAMCEEAIRLTEKMGE